MVRWSFAAKEFRALCDITTIAMVMFSKDAFKFHMMLWEQHNQTKDCSISGSHGGEYEV
jgi:hypothetical protein